LLSWTTEVSVVHNVNMDAESIMRERVALDEQSFAEIVIWRVVRQVPGSTHGFKYRLAYVVDGRCVLRYDNETGKGDHRHIGARQSSYIFTSPAQLLVDFWNDVNQWSK